MNGNGQNGNNSGKREVVIRINKVVEEKDCAFGVLPNGEKVVMFDETLAAAMRKVGTHEVEAHYFRAVVVSNPDPNYASRTPWKCIYIREHVDESEFSEPPARELDGLEMAVEEILKGAETFFPAIKENEIAIEVLNQGVEVAEVATHVTTRVAKLKAERGPMARDILAELLTKGALRGLILDECRKRIELGEDAYWNPPAGSNSGRKPGKKSGGKSVDTGTATPLVVQDAAAETAVAAG